MLHEPLGAHYQRYLVTFLVAGSLVLLLGNWVADVAIRSGTVHPMRVLWMFAGARIVGVLCIGISAVLNVILGLVILVAVFLAFTAIWTDVLWYRSVGFSSVYTKQITTRVLLFFSAAITAEPGLGRIARLTFHE